MILGRSTNHCRTANVDVLNGIVKRGVRPTDCFLKWVQVDRKKVYGLDAVLIHDALRLFRAGQEDHRESRGAAF